MSQTTGCERFEAQRARKSARSAKRREVDHSESASNSNACEPCRHGLAEGARRSAPRRCPRASGRGSTPRSAFAAFCLPVCLSFSVPAPLMLLLPYCCRRCHFSRCHRLRRRGCGLGGRARAGVRHGGAREPQVGVRLPAPPLLPSVCLSARLLCVACICADVVDVDATVVATSSRSN